MAQDDSSASTTREPGPELRLVDRRAFVGFPELVLAPGIVITDFALEIPDVTFPFNVTGGATRYQRQRLDFGHLELTVDADAIRRRLAELAPKLAELDELRLHFRPGSIEAQARLRDPERTPVTFKVAFEGEGERLCLVCYDVRLYGFSALPAARVPTLLLEALCRAGVLPDAERRGASTLVTRLLPRLVEAAAVGRGFRVPALDVARIGEVLVSSRGLRLRFGAGALPPPAAPDEALLLALEGIRAFAEAEELLALGRLGEARGAFLRLGDAADAHPFAAERLLTLLVADPRAHEFALDIAAALQRRDEQSATALWAEAVIRERRGELARASERYLALCTLARRNHEAAGAFFAAEAAARAARDQAPHLAVKALHELLGLRPDHLPSLKALARASDRAKDRAGAMRAYRRLAALAREPADAAEAHVRLARLCAELEGDLAGARLHCEAALRLAPDEPDALELLGELCFRGGEHLRAVRALDRLRDLARRRDEPERMGRADLLAARVWEHGLQQPENARLRYREAASLLPGDPIPLVGVGRVAEGLGRLQEAVTAYTQAVELAGPAPRTPEARRSAHEAHRSLARLLKTRLGDPARAREHLEAAIAVDPSDVEALDELLPHFRASGKLAELAAACESAAGAVVDARRRAALLLEAGELYRLRLGEPDRAERLLVKALELAPRSRPALQGLLGIAEGRRDGPLLCRCLEELLPLAQDAEERERLARRLAVAARDVALDLDRAAFGFREALKSAPDDVALAGELAAVERRRGDAPGLAWALEQRARVAEAHGDRVAAASALRELASVLDGRLARTTEAVAVLERSTQLAADPAALVELADLALRVSRPAVARRALEDALAALPTRQTTLERVAELRARLAGACEALGDSAAALAHAEQAFPHRKLDDELARRLEALYGAAGRTREQAEFWRARADALLQAGRAADAAPLLVKSGRALQAAGETHAAQRQLSAALEANLGDDDARAVLESLFGLELARGGRGEAARFAARRAARAQSQREAAEWYFKAATCARDTAREAELLVRAIDADGSFVPARVRRAELVEATHPREALEHLTAVLALAPEAPELATTGFDRGAETRRAAFLALRASQTDAARRLLTAHCRSRPDDVEAHLELARLLRLAGALDELVELLGPLWPHLAGEARAAAVREYVEGARSVGKVDAAMAALRARLAEAPTDPWASAQLLELLPVTSATTDERLALLSLLVSGAEGARRGELLARRAELHRARGELRAARADLLEAARLAADPVPVFALLVDVARAGADDAAELEAWQGLAASRLEGAHLDEAKRRVPRLARARAEAGDHRLAVSALELALALPLAPEEHLALNRLLARSAREAGSSEIAERAWLAVAASGPAAQRVEALLERAALLEERRALEPLVATLEQALALAPTHATVTARLKQALAAAGDWEGLAEVLGAEAARAPKEAATPLWVELAELFASRLQRPGPAEAALRRAMALEPKAPRLRRALARHLAAQGERAEAVSLLESAAELCAGAESAADLREAAVLAAAGGLPEAELRCLRRARAIEPLDPSTLGRLCRILYLHGSVREALPLHVELANVVAFDDAPEQAEEALLHLAELAQQANDTALAEEGLRRLASERPHHLQAAERLADLIASRDPRGAVELLARQAETLSAPGRRAERFVLLARRAGAELGDVDFAAKLYESASQAAEDPLPVQLELASLLRQHGKTQALRRALAEVGHLHLAGGRVAQALEAWSEEARTALASGEPRECVRTLNAMADVCGDVGMGAEAASHLLRAATLEADALADLDGAAETLARAWELDPRPDVASAAVAFERRRRDATQEVSWLQRLLGAQESPGDRAATLVRLARIHLGLRDLAEGQGPQAAKPAQPDGPAPVDAAATRSVEAGGATSLALAAAEAELQEALTLAPRHEEAERLLTELLERQGRSLELAAYWESAASASPDSRVRAALLSRAAELYRDRVERLPDAAAALLAARAAAPEDVTITARLVEVLRALGRDAEAADFEALVLEVDPFHPCFDGHRRTLEAAGDELALAALLSRRAEGLGGGAAADAWLDAARAFHRAGATERARLCEARAFELAPDNQVAFALLMSWAEASGDVRRQASLLGARARAVPAEAEALLRDRAERLGRAQESSLAAEAWDDVLALTPDDAAALEHRAALAEANGGVRAAQPFDRRLLRLGAEAVRAAQRLRSLGRLGRAALEAGAWLDAIDAFEAVVELEPEGTGALEALAALGELYGRLGDSRGLSRTALRLARKAEGPEADALLRRAVAVAAAPEDAVEALDALLPRHPTEVDLYLKGRRAYEATGRAEDLVALHARHAAAVTERSAAAAALSEAARVCEERLRDDGRALELRLQALEADPNATEVAAQALKALRRLDDVPRLLALIRLLIPHTADRGTVAALRSERDTLVERLGERVASARARGLHGEALVLEESLVESVEELERVLQGFVEIELVAHAARLGTRLLDAGRLSRRLWRPVAERLSSCEQGAPLAIRLWALLLRSEPADADGWTLLAIALRAVARVSDSLLADGFGAALTDSGGPAPTALPGALPGRGAAPLAPPPPKVELIDAASMPRLASELEGLLAGFRTRVAKLLLDPAGGPVLWRTDGDCLVVGAGALAVFGRAELAYAVALAECLGAAGRGLDGVTLVEELPEAAGRAFDAYPASLAACRVLAHVDHRARGMDPGEVRPSALLRESDGFRRVALRALDRLER